MGWTKLESACSSVCLGLAVSILLSRVSSICVCISADNSTLPSLAEATADELQAGLGAGLFTSVDLVNAYVARIKEVNGSVRAVTELNPDALGIASQLDVERGNGTVRGPLHGIPILIKNNIATNDELGNTAGSYALIGAKVPRDATVVRKLRKAGAIILGKTNLSQWANFRSNNSTSGWSAYGGQVIGAYYPNQDPSGSSSGSGVGSALGLALASLGTETDGSILSPSNKNNLVGIKPSVGLTSRDLVIPISPRQDTVGPMARTVKDAAYLLQAIAGVDPSDNYTLAIPNGGSLPDYVAACRLSALSEARIGVPTNVIEFYNSDGSFDTEVAAFKESLAVLAAAGATVVPDANYTAFSEFVQSQNETLVLGTDFVANLPTYLSRLTQNPAKVSNLAEVRAFTQSDPREDYPDRDTGIWDAALNSSTPANTSPEVWAAYTANQFLGGAGGLLGALDAHDLDAVVLPTSFSPGISAIIGAPVVTVPLGFYPADASVESQEGARGLVDTAPGVPFGLSFAGRRWSEDALVGFAYAFEQRTRARADGKPWVSPTTELGHVLVEGATPPEPCSSG
ncbi:amidase [Phyllosticta citriasiana]|uniref:Amidase n=2 Tax=Phyllosticta citriasiana TaxID=595635 RepID=A0ABR1KPV7_9PEZI